jgi:hypothetical protein
VKRVRLIGDHHAVHHHGAELTVAHDAVVGGGAVLEHFTKRLNR